MIPSVLSDQIKRGVGNYLKTTFQITTPHFSSLMDDFLDEEADHLLKGPYLSMQLPFIKEKMDEDPFQNFQQGFNRFVLIPPASSEGKSGKNY